MGQHTNLCNAPWAQVRLAEVHDAVVKSFGICLVTPSRVYQLSAPNATDQIEWCNGDFDVMHRASDPRNSVGSRSYDPTRGTPTGGFSEPEVDTSM